MGLSGLDAVGRPNKKLPESNSIVTGKSQGEDGARAHEGGQTGEGGCSIQLCIEVTALLRTELQPPPLPK